MRVVAAQGVLRVEDTGPGLAEADTERAFERFYLQLPLTRIAPITNNLAKAYIAERVLGMPRSYGPGRK